eukprot:CAMPEP_0113320956 /NCGR_PEP_ID=MMETSP0010_2-20120614/14603_1 /TAXON_ID=216773 ORGANISM="Corethron hystrix, Strain 308" /NCGR_SAMPLE_ID=MMETSP0010_2 /ASSEMBLY_ACC=CAM_ASM_000155 /LENGTH=211 /DNA_ID=CAMNT_0000178933 /DNA_START=169 /DNA_END=804 /DNA_ORIENTATION=+ /assembly_acc=CAM_ASM_000155
MTVKIEAHCGLEAPRSLGYSFARERAKSVREALVGFDVDRSRLHIKSFSNARPLVWAFGHPEGNPNRRVELYVTCAGFEVPQRRKMEEYARPPSDFDWYSDADDDDDQGDVYSTSEEEDDDGVEGLRATVMRYILRGQPVPGDILERFLNAAAVDRAGASDLQQVFHAVGQFFNDENDDQSQNEMNDESSSSDDTHVDNSDEENNIMDDSS